MKREKNRLSVLKIANSVQVLVVLVDSCPIKLAYSWTT